MTEWSQLDSKCFYCCGKKDATRMPTMFLQSKIENASDIFCQCRFA